MSSTLSSDRSSEDPSHDNLGAPPAPRRFACLDGYRGLAAMTVLVYHVMGKLGFHLDHPLLGEYTARLGNYGVTVFFVLSGFLLYRPFVLAHFQDRPQPRIGTFYLRRLARIIPAFWIALVFDLYIFRYFHSHSLDETLTYFSFLQIYRPGGLAIGALGQAWSLDVEMTFYLMLPWFGYALARFRTGTGELHAKVRGQVLGLGAVYVVSLGYKLWAIPNRGTYPVAHLWLPARLDLFVIGMFMAVASAWMAVGGRLPRIIDRFVRSPWVCLIFAAEAYWLLVQLNLSRGFAADDFGQDLLRYPFAGLSAMFLLIPGTLGRDDRGAVAGFFRSGPMAFLGSISYGIYLWHTMWLEFALRGAANGYFSTDLWVMLIIVSALTIGSATLSYWLVERPILNLVHRRHQRRQPVREDAGRGS